MGNTSNGAFIAIKITNDPSVPIAGGSSVTGIVYLDVENSSVPCDSLNVCLVGHEKTRVLYHETGNRCQRSHFSSLSYASSSLSLSFSHIFSLTISYPTVQDGKEAKQEKKLEYETHAFLTLDCVLAMFPQGKVTKGRYEFPFIFPLPPGIPGRLCATSLNGDDTFSISYHLEARLYRRGAVSTSTSHKDEVKNSLEIMVCDPPRPVIPASSFVDPVTTTMRFYCCLHTGTMTLSGSLDSASVDAGEEAKVIPLISFLHIFYFTPLRYL